MRFEGGEEQVFRIVEDLRMAPAAGSVVVDDTDAGFYATPYFWTAGRGVDGREKSRGYGNRYFTYGRRTAPGEYARFTPDLAEGRYEVRLRPETPYTTMRPSTSASGTETARRRPHDPLAIPVRRRLRLRRREGRVCGNPRGELHRPRHRRRGGVPLDFSERMTRPA